MNKEQKNNGLVLGLLIAFGIPAIFWAYFDWRAALVSFVVGQLILGFCKITLAE